ncbi:S-adenosyl-L-methionine-dependent methyltransferase [Schizophyllum amplum]|uniref:Arsenite methyltransferase n=1 Tax=Schizophyllum amplum TaxID=97359 RepID=A0A550CC52_9AGAR|nr:S-adenosyl-L-methionine-dependent methyltransferase [Auriculariopsis ampla]
MSVNDVREFYGKVTETATGTGQYNTRVANAFGYTAEELSAIPTDANLGLSCGNPIATANIKEGETFVDLGSGAGLDVFLAARQVGEKGRAIGIDMTDEMLDLARRNAAKGNYANVEFVKSRITEMDLPDSTADIVSSNCVINLVPEPEKHVVFREIFRILKPGGRLAVSDILAKTDLPDYIRKDLTLYVGCIAGASQSGQYEKWMKEAGFEDIAIVDTNKDLNVYQSDKQSIGCCGKGSTCSPQKSDPGMNINFNEYVGSYQIYAIKPNL